MAEALGPGSVLVVDDRPEEPRGLLGELDDIVEIVHPMELLPQQFQNAKLVLVDHDLQDKDWPQRTTFPLACQPRDGIALAHIFLGQFRSAEFEHVPPTAVGLLSSQLDLITPGFELVPEHIAARTAGLHWAFWKKPLGIDPEEPSLSERIRLLATAVTQLPQNWHGGSHFDHFRDLLGLNSRDVANWAAVGADQALRCRPPIHELATWTSGLALIRWLSQRILPYPTFLVGLDSLAVRLGVTPEWFRKNMRPNMPLQSAFQNAEYRGMLSTFLGRRWWGAGVDDVLLAAGAEIPFSRTRLAEWLQSISGAKPAILQSDHTLVINDRTVFSIGLTAPFTECVRLELDEWPSFAEEPWTTLDLAVKSERLGSSVHRDEEGRIFDEQ